MGSLERVAAIGSPGCPRLPPAAPGCPCRAGRSATCPLPGQAQAGPADGTVLTPCPNRRPRRPRPAFPGWIACFPCQTCFACVLGLLWPRVYYWAGAAGSGSVARRTPSAFRPPRRARCGAAAPRSLGARLAPSRESVRQYCSVGTGQTEIRPPACSSHRRGTRSTQTPPAWACAPPGTADLGRPPQAWCLGDQEASRPCSRPVVQRCLSAIASHLDDVAKLGCDIV